MTAINVAIPPGGVVGVMLSDTAGYDDNGVIRCFSPKVITLPHMGTVVAARGHVDIVQWAADTVAEFPSLDEVVQECPPALCAGWRQILDATPAASMDLVVMGWSTTMGQIKCYAATADSGFVFADAPVYLAPIPDEAAMIAAGLLVPGHGIAFQNGVHEVLLKIMELQRAEPMPFNKATPERLGHVIGGHAILTVIDRETIIQKVIRRWPDKIGQLISP
jgi:hypothetical protein